MQKFLFNAQKTKNNSPAKLYAPKDVPWGYSCAGKFGNTAQRQVNTIFDYDTAPYSNMVLGEVINDRGNWSGYLPHYHPHLKFTISNLIDQKVLVLVLSEMMYLKALMVVLPLSLTAKLIHKL